MLPDMEVNNPQHLVVMLPDMEVNNPQHLVVMLPDMEVNNPQHLVVRPSVEGYVLPCQVTWNFAKTGK